MRTTSLSSAAAPAATWPQSKLPSLASRPPASRSVEPLAVLASTLAAYPPRFLIYFSLIDFVTFSQIYLSKFGLIRFGLDKCIGALD